MNLKDTYNKIAEDWHRDHQSDDWWIGGADIFVSFLKPGATVLDVGCGTGIKSKYLTDKGLKVTGIDFSEKMIDIARETSPAANFQIVDLKDMVKNLRENYDGIFAQAVLLHIPKKEMPDIFKKFRTKIKQGGYLYVAIKEKKPDGREEEIKQEKDYGYAYERFFSYFTLEEIEEYFKRAGFKVVFNLVNSSGNVRWIQVIGELG